tara:strand:+ start:865 stop:1029 length:165 start_codon:yes stop_codon:yes gene_type:complete
MNNPKTFKEAKVDILKKIEKLSKRERDCIKILWSRCIPIKGFNRYNEKITITFD